MRHLETRIAATVKAMIEAARPRLPEVAPLQRLFLQAHVPVSPSQLDCSDDMPQLLTVGKSDMERSDVFSQYTSRISLSKRGKGS